MKNILILIFGICALAAAGQYIGNWDNFILRGTGYQLFTPDSDHVWVIRERDGSAVTGEQIVDFEVRGDYVFFLRMVSNSVDCYDESGVPTLITHYGDDEEYWVVSNSQGSEFGPMSRMEFFNWLKMHQVADVDLRVPKSYRSNTAAFESSLAKCASLNPPLYSSPLQ